MIEKFSTFVGEQYTDEINRSLTLLADEEGLSVNVMNEDIPATLDNIDVEPNRLNVILSSASKITRFYIG